MEQSKIIDTLETYQDAIPSTLVVSSPMPQFTAEEAGIEEMEDEDVDIGCTTPVNDDFWESQHPNSSLFTPLQQIPQSPVATKVQMGSEEPRPTPSVHEKIPATSADENVNEELKTQAAAE